MIDPSGGHDDLTAGIPGNFEYARPQTEPKEFKPWHKPRKQFVRREQLSILLRDLYRRRGPSEPLRYLGLPGTDLIDLRYLYEQICRGCERPLHFLGFNTEAYAGNPADVQLNISLDEMRQLPNVDAQSDVLHDDFRRVGNPNSIAWDRTRQIGPFDVVNIDLCDGFLSDAPQSDASIYSALARLMAFQARNSNPWLILIATRMSQGMFDSEAERKIVDHFRENVANCEGFAEACEEVLESDVRSIDTSTCSESEYLNLMTVAISKWLSALVQAVGPSRVTLASTYGYKINPVAACEDMVSLALRFDPVIKVPSDPFSPTAPDPVDECATAKDILRQTTERLNVDKFLERQPDLLEDLIGETEMLLTLARYQTTGYRQWLNA